MSRGVFCYDAMWVYRYTAHERRWQKTRRNLRYVKRMRDRQAVCSVLDSRAKPETSTLAAGSGKARKGGAMQTFEAFATDLVVRTAILLFRALMGMPPRSQQFMQCVNFPIKPVCYRLLQQQAAATPRPPSQEKGATDT